MLEHLHDLEGRFAHIQEEMQRRRGARARVRSIRPWGEVRIAPAASSGEDS